MSSAATTEAPLLSPRLVQQAEAVGAAVAAGNLGALVGAGLSMSCGLCNWSDLIRRLQLAAKQWELSATLRNLSDDAYIELLQRVFPDDTVKASYLRTPRRGRGWSQSDWGQLVYAALYSDPAGHEFTPQPNDVHRRLVSIFAEHPGQIWTTNYDDLLEEAARSLRIAARGLDAHRRQLGAGFAVTHLHGFLPPKRPNREQVSLLNAPIVLAEDDYHSIAADIVGWTNRGFHTLFDERQVLILGMSLLDQNVRRAIFSTHDPRRSAPHFAVTPAMSDLKANRLRRAFWRRFGVEIIELPDVASMAPFLSRVRYASAPGLIGASDMYTHVNPWSEARQRFAAMVLADAKQRLIDGMALADPDEIVEIGVFLLKPGGRVLELVFRGGAGRAANPGEREFSADLDAPTGTPGRVFVSGDVARVATADPMHRWGLGAAGPASARGRSAGVIAAPLVDWAHGGEPIGTVYLSVSTVRGELFALPAEHPPAGKPGLKDLGAWFQEIAMELLQTLARVNA